MGMLRNLASLAVLAILSGNLWAQAPAAQAPPPAAKPAAVVNGEPIPFSEVKALLDQQPPPPNPLSKHQQLFMQETALEMLIDDLLMKQFLRKNGPKVDPAAVNKEIAELEDGLKKKKLTLQDFLKDTAQTEAQLRGEIIARLQWAGYAKEHVSDTKVKDYYTENKLFFDKVVVRASHILLRVAASATAAEKQAAKDRLTALRQDIIAGKIDFAEAAKKNSDCPSKKDGGDIGFFPYKFVVLEPFAKAAFALKVGEISDLVQTDYGLHLIKVTDRKPGEASNFEKIQKEVREVCEKELWDSILSQTRRNSDIQVNLQK
jgi:peptidyl-prolyl cis-trans isomerase C